MNYADIPRILYIFDRLKIFIFKQYMQHSDDILLLRLIQQNDRIAFRHLFYEYMDSLVRFVNYYIQDKEKAEEIVSDLFVYVWEHRATLQIKITLKAYLFQSAKNKAFTYLRDRQPALFLADQSQADPGQEDSYQMEVDELSRLIEEAVSLLPDKCREIFRKSRGENLTNKEIAFLMGITEKTVENQIAIALKRIRKYLGNNYSYLW